MPKRKTPHVRNEYYHIYNRGTDKRLIITDKRDLARLIETIHYCNNTKPMGSLKTAKSCPNIRASQDQEPLVDFVAFCVNTNHFHFLLKQKSENGIQLFMQRLGTGYTNYFNKRHNRSGGLFQGRFKSKHINSNEYLIRASVYVNLNYKLHNLNLEHDPIATSMHQYSQTQPTPQIRCDTEIVLAQFTTPHQYHMYAENIIRATIEHRKKLKQIKSEAGLRSPASEFKP